MLLGNALHAQGGATVSTGFSAIQYDGLLGSAAGFFSPALRYNGQSVSLAARGELILFESGNEVLQGSAAGAWLSPAAGKLRADVGGVGGISAYADAPAAGHFLGRARVHLMGTTRGAWIGGALGRTYVEGTAYPGSEFGLGAWLVARRLGFTATVTGMHAVDSTFVDFRAAAHWTPTPVELTAYAGLRAVTSGNATMLYGELTVRLPVTHAITAVASGGQFPPDPLRRTLGGRHITVGVELSLFARPAVPAPLLEALGREHERADAGTAPRLTVVTGPGDTRTVRVHAPRTRRVELTGDFTDWEPTTLLNVGNDLWELTLDLTPGIYRVNVRLDGGRWMVPLGARPEEGEFGEAVGVVVVW